MRYKGFTPYLSSSSLTIKASKTAGFTLTEVLIAMLLLSLVAAGMFTVFIVGRRFTSGGGRKLEALNFARQTIESLKDDVHVDGWGWTPPGDPLSLGLHNEPLPAGDFRDKWTIGIPNPRSYQVNWGSNDYGPNQRYKVVTVTVSWNEPP